MKHIHHLRGTFRNIWKMPAAGWRMHFVLRASRGTQRRGWELHSHCSTWKSGDADRKQGDDHCPTQGTWEVQGGFYFHSQPFQCLPGRGERHFFGNYTTIPVTVTNDQGKGWTWSDWWGNRGWEATGVLRMLLPRFPN